MKKVRRGSYESVSVVGTVVNCGKYVFFAYSSGEPGVPQRFYYDGIVPLLIQQLRKELKRLLHRLHPCLPEGRLRRCWGAGKSREIQKIRGKTLTCTVIMGKIGRKPR
jgi:hypothetical protein